MGKKVWTPEERKAFADKMKTGREAHSAGKSAPVPAQPKAVLPVKVKKPRQPIGNMLRLMGGIGSIVLALLIGTVWWIYFSDNPIPGVIAFIFIVVGIYFITQYFGKRGEKGEAIIIPAAGEEGTPTDTKVVRGKLANSLNLYPDRVVFEPVENPLGQPWKCQNDSKLYYVHKWDEIAKTLNAFVLPDQQYMDPGIFATRVLELPAHRRIFMRKQSLLQQLSPAIMVLAIVAFGIIIVVTTGK